MSKQSTWTVSDDFNDAAYKKLGGVLKQLGFKLDSEYDGFEFHHWDFSSSAGKLVVESDIYTGLTVSGNQPLIDKVKKTYALAA